MSTSSLFVSVFPRLSSFDRLVGKRWLFASLLMTSLSTVFFTEVASSVSVRFSPLLELEAPGVIAVSGGTLLHTCVFRWLLCGFLLLVFMHFWYCRWRSKRVSCRRAVQCRRLWFLWCFDNCAKVFLCPAVLGDSSYASRVHNSFTICSDQMFVCEVALAQPHGGFPTCRPASVLGGPDPFPTSGRRASTDSPNSSTFSTIRTTHRTIERGLCIVAPETRNEPSCVSNNPFHQCTVSGRSVLRAVLHGYQHCAHLSLKPFLIDVHCCVALVRSSGTTSDDCSFWTFRFRTFCPHHE